MSLPSIVITARGIPLTLEPAITEAGELYNVWMGPICLGEAWWNEYRQGFTICPTDYEAPGADIWSFASTAEQRIQECCDMVIDRLLAAGKERQAKINGVPA